MNVETLATHNRAVDQHPSILTHSTLAIVSRMVLNLK